MNKARMTIRFEPNPPKETQHDQLRVVPPIREREDDGDETDPEWRPLPNNRSRGRLAEERRRLDQNDGWLSGDASVQEDIYYDAREEHYDLHPDLHRESVDMEVNDNRWSHGYESDLYESPADDHSYYRSRKPTSLWKMILSVSAAVITGLLFGYMMLSMFNGENASEKPAAEQVESQIAGNPAKDDSFGGMESTLTPDLIESGVHVPGQLFYMLQYGVFSTSERAAQARVELEQSGIAAGGDLDEENRVYAGISPDREQAKLLSNQLMAEGVELYVKEITLPGIESAAFAGEGQTLSDYFTVSGQLVSELSTLSVSLLGMQQTESVTPQIMNTITNLHQQWIQIWPLLSAGLGPESETVLPEMEQSMNSSITALFEYNKNQSKGHLWEIQTGMMNYVMGQKKLLEGL
ncbi:SPOR domain-containing protein [Paenibacillus solani]|uniref:Sporulation protein n=1 Tax=Paenibacillus solani TaxID=1705565 RepID=A0A0M1P1N1_9BACL|nr:SPOR domain-containing protein [Paenibacillus solani]KOR88200.1 sporulation protein [Paenibacillus solani]